MDSLIYFDNSSTTKPCETAIKYINDSLSNFWGNPSSLHTLGMYAEERINLARDCIAKSINALPNEIFFTSSGTEANNIAILGAANALKRRGNRIVTTAIEHPSVLNTIKYLEENGFEVIYLKPDQYGVINTQELINAINKNTILVSIMLVNNELGSIEPVTQAANAIKQANSPALLHTDAVQAFGKLPINIKTLGVDLLSASGHKIHGPKGIGFLYKSKKANIISPVFGGGQELGVRSGTQPTPAIMGLMGAVQELKNLNEQLNEINNLKQYCVSKLQNFCSINSNSDCLPYILNVSVTGYKSETILHFLESKNIFVSSGSACAKGKKSHVLLSCGLNRKQIDSSIRISFSRFNTKNEIDALCNALQDACNTLRKAY